MTAGTMESTPTGAPRYGGFAALMSRHRWLEVGRIALTGVVALLYWRQSLSIAWLWAAVAIGLYPLVKTGLQDLVHERTQSFCTDRFFLQKRDNRVTVRVLIGHGADFA